MTPVAVVTGATGFIGWNLCESLRDAGWEVRAVVRPASGNPLPAGVRKFDATLDAGDMAPACEGAAAVFHLAGLTRATSWAEFERVNTDGALQAAIAARREGAFFLLVSSQAAAGPGTLSEPTREEDRPRPVSLYGRSKLAGEEAVAAVADLAYAIVRPPGVYGPRDRDFLALFRAARYGIFPRLGSAHAAYTLMHVADAVAAMRAVTDAALGGSAAVLGETFFLGHPEPVRQGELPRLLGPAVGRRVWPLPVPRSLLWLLAQVGEVTGRLGGRPGLVNRSRYRELTAPGFVCDVSKIQRRLACRAVIDARSGLASTAEWYRSAGWL